MEGKEMGKVFIHVAMFIGGFIAVRLFDHAGSASVQLKRTEIVATSQITSLRFRMIK